ncbi:DUF423 domain-containing protein [Alicyclobacillus acidiphilus]|uniref:DUF423 domain-containing protein n=1 Tax=Alicyclobacillus acidiphilus TaxID=182455 RepID=UPI00082AE913|nr:DUF423 domain-containing protein [Alicyclobacillus acidiphilus]
MGFAVIGGILAFLSVAVGAFGAHVISSRISSDMLSVYHTGDQYQMYHALALIAVGILIRLNIGGKSMHAAGWLFFIGTVLFSGSLYILSTTGTKAAAIGALTPLGGLCFLAGWVCFIVGLVR